MELEQDYSKDKSSGSGTEIAYTVEARYNYHDPKQFCGQIFDKQWRQVQFKQGEFGVPSCAPFHRHTIEHGMFGYAAAQALRWWVHATAEAETSGGLCLETRVVSHKISYSHKIEAVKAHCHIHGEDRSNCIPNWGLESNDQQE